MNGSVPAGETGQLSLYLPPAIVDAKQSVQFIMIGDDCTHHVPH